MAKERIRLNNCLVCNLPLWLGPCARIVAECPAPRGRVQALCAHAGCLDLLDQPERELLDCLADYAVQRDAAA